jgi:Tfp pilus assembly protein PilX
MRLSHKRGAALIVSLVLLTAVTSVAIVSMENSSTQIKVVGNNQVYETVFQTSMSELEAKVGNALTNTSTFAESRFSAEVDENGVAKFDPITLEIQYNAVPLDEEPYYKNVDVTAATRYVGQGTMNTTLHEGDGGDFQTIPFEVTASSSAGRLRKDGKRSFTSNQSVRFTFKANRG